VTRGSGEDVNAPSGEGVEEARSFDAVAIGDLVVVKVFDSSLSNTDLAKAAALANRIPWPDVEPALRAARNIYMPSTAELDRAFRTATGVFGGASLQTADDGPASPANDRAWGSEVSDEEASKLELANLHLQWHQRREQLNLSFSREQAAEMLGVSPQTVSDWVAQHKLVGIKDGREWRFPAWQFTPDNAEPVLPEVRRLVEAFPGGEVSLSRWMNRPNDNFDGRTPAQEMIRDSDHVLAVVGSLAAA